MLQIFSLIFLWLSPYRFIICKGALDLSQYQMVLINFFPLYLSLLHPVTFITHLSCLRGTLKRMPMLYY